MTGVAARLAVVVVIAAAALPALLASAAPSRSGVLYSGPGFDTCSAPTTATMQSWLASPYRAVGIYIGGVNRACPDGNLSPAWVSGVVASGWNLLPLYVGLQAPCVAQAGLALINPSTATADGSAAAGDAVARATAFGLAAGSPIYFDMEGYNTNSPACTKAVQSFVAGWVAGLRGRGFLAGVYGSAASTIRDLIPSAGNPVTGPDAVWIANWNGQTGVFGDPYVADTYWPSHQRIHQYRGGHKETYAGVTVNVDSNTVDGPAVGPGNVPPPAPPPQPQPQAGSVTTSDGFTTVSWPADAFAGTPTVTATPTKLSASVGGFAAGSYVVQLSVTNADGSAVTRFAAPVTVAFRTAAPIAVPAIAANGTSWKPLPSTAYTRNADGSLTVSTTSAGSIGLLRDVAPPSKPAGLTGRFVHHRLVLAWRAPTDNSGSLAGYEITLNGKPLASAAATAPSASLLAFYPNGPSVFRVSARDAAGNVSAGSAPVVVRPTPRPASVPYQIPNWTFQLYAWQQAGRGGKRPAAPLRLPAWYWQWAAWRLHPFRVV
ncbi:MAG TPA: DUF1906 domain-containing protein [Gaiellaceae bacterium]|nr:DUF1906 domain-containing protein [Gaiellaceae bacterium]